MVDMIFRGEAGSRECLEQNLDFYTVFIDLKQSLTQSAERPFDLIWQNTAAH